MARRVDKPWGHEIWFAETDKYVGKVLRVNAGHRLSLQYHEVKTETLYVYEGEIDFEIEEAGEMVVKRLKSGDSIHVSPGTKHRFRAVSDASVLEASTPETWDVVRLADDYSREGKKEEHERK